MLCDAANTDRAPATAATHGDLPTPWQPDHDTFCAKLLNRRVTTGALRPAALHTGADMPESSVVVVGQREGAQPDRSADQEQKGC